MLFSFIIPTLNEDKLIESVLQQFSEFKILCNNDCEIIISDGGSKDKTIQIAKQYADVILVKDKNDKENIAIGRNRGGFQAKGEILIFINADVYIENMKVFYDELINFINDKKLVAMTGNVKVFKEEEKIRDKVFHFIFNNYFRLLNQIGFGMGRGECQVVKKQAFYKVNGYNPAMNAGEDMDLYGNLKKIGDIYFSRKLLFFESPRRYRKQGYIKTVVRWILNAIVPFFSKKSFSNEWEEVR